jgi:Transcriptional regulator, AbiEi antitoxin, Type IV TA system
MRITELDSAFVERLEKILGSHLTRVIAPVAAGAWDADSTYDTVIDGHSWRISLELHLRVPAGIERHTKAAAGHSLNHARALRILVVPRLLPRHRHRLREAGIMHGDLRGVVWLRAPGLMIDVDRATEESHAMEDEIPDGAASGAPDPFQDRTTLLLRILASTPTRSYGVTELAELSDISKGWVSRATREFIRRRYAARAGREIRLTDAARLLTDWRARYQWRDNSVRRFSVPFSLDEQITKLRQRTAPPDDTGVPPYALTLHAGAALLAPHVRQENLTIHVSRAWRADMEDWARTTLHAQEVRMGGNLQLVDPYYRHSVFHGYRHVQGLPVVSSLQLYLDLVHYTLRGKEAADVLLRSVLKQELALKSEQVRMLISDDDV